MYGIEVPSNYTGDIPEGMECLSIPEGPYAIFHHPPYNYIKMERTVDDAMERFIKKWNPADHGYEWDDSKPTYCRHNPAQYGQATIKPMKIK